MLLGKVVHQHGGRLLFFLLRLQRLWTGPVPIGPNETANGHIGGGKQAQQQNHHHGDHRAALAQSQFEKAPQNPAQDAGGGTLYAAKVQILEHGNAPDYLIGIKHLGDGRYAQNAEKYAQAPPDPLAANGEKEQQGNPEAGKRQNAKANPTKQPSKNIPQKGKNSPVHVEQCRQQHEGSRPHNDSCNDGGGNGRGILLPLGSLGTGRSLGFFPGRLPLPARRGVPLIRLCTFLFRHGNSFL